MQQHYCHLNRNRFVCMSISIDQMPNVVSAALVFSEIRRNFDVLFLIREEKEEKLIRNWFLCIESPWGTLLNNKFSRRHHTIFLGDFSLLHSLFTFSLCLSFSFSLSFSLSLCCSYLTLFACFLSRSISASYIASIANRNEIGYMN